MAQQMNIPTKYQEEISDQESLTSHTLHFDELEDGSMGSPFGESEEGGVNKPSKKIRKKRNAYAKVNDELRMKLLNAVQHDGETLKGAAKKFGINYSTAKSILHTYRKEGRITKKSTHDKPSKKKNDPMPGFHESGGVRRPMHNRLGFNDGASSSYHEEEKTSEYYQGGDQYSTPQSPENLGNLTNNFNSILNIRSHSNTSHSNTPYANTPVNNMNQNQNFVENGQMSHSQSPSNMYHNQAKSNFQNNNGNNQNGGSPFHQNSQNFRNNNQGGMSQEFGQQQGQFNSQGSYSRQQSQEQQNYDAENRINFNFSSQNSRENFERDENRKDSFSSLFGGLNNEKKLYYEEHINSQTNIDKVFNNNNNQNNQPNFQHSNSYGQQDFNQQGGGNNQPNGGNEDDMFAKPDIQKRQSFQRPKRQSSNISDQMGFDRANSIDRSQAVGNMSLLEQNQLQDQQRSKTFMRNSSRSSSYGNPAMMRNQFRFSNDYIDISPQKMQMGGGQGDRSFNEIYGQIDNFYMNYSNSPLSTDRLIREGSSRSNGRFNPELDSFTDMVNALQKKGSYGSEMMQKRGSFEDGNFRQFSRNSSINMGMGGPGSNSFGNNSFGHNSFGFGNNSGIQGSNQNNSFQNNNNNNMFNNSNNQGGGNQQQFGGSNDQQFGNNNPNIFDPNYLLNDSYKSQTFDEPQYNQNPNQGMRLEDDPFN